MFMYNIVLGYSLAHLQTRGVNGSVKYFPYYSVEFVIHIEAIIHAFPNMVFGFGHIPIPKYHIDDVMPKSRVTYVTAVL